jgi:predicted DNA-binding protein YlxM (UPF0122 family)
MEKDLEFIELFETYKGLLTKRQRELFSSHYLYDLSLSEIAEPEGLSRQSVYDAVKKVKSKLIEYEKVLGLYKIKTEIKKLSNKLTAKDEEIVKELESIIGE